MTLFQPPRRPGALIAPPPSIPCTCPPRLTHPDRSACYRHGKTDVLDRAVQLLRAGHAGAAMRVLDRAARRPWWRPQTPAGTTPTAPTHPATPQHRRTA